MSEPLQHSPGPWTYDSITMRVSDADGEVVCEIMRDNTTHDDGRVVAAAPDMLRLLREILNPYVQWSELGDHIAEARKLIARLDGAE